MANDSELIAEALGGKREAFADLVRQYQDRLFASMIQVTGSLDEAEDVVQEAFIRAFIKLETFQQHSQFFTWLYRIAFNTALSRKRKARGDVSLELSRESGGVEVAATQDDVDEGLLRDERVAHVQAALSRLTEDHRAILVLREMEGHDYETIAEVLQVSIGTVRSRLNRARRQLKLTLEEMESVDPTRLTGGETERDFNRTTPEIQDASPNS